jgi:hypothetical protein
VAGREEAKMQGKDDRREVPAPRASSLFLNRKDPACFAISGPFPWRSLSTLPPFLWGVPGVLRLSMRRRLERLVVQRLRVGLFRIWRGAGVEYGKMMDRRQG